MTKRTIFALVMLAASTQFVAASASAAATETDQWCVPAAAIADDGVISRTVAVPPTTDVRTIVGVRVRVAATHPWVGDLAFRVRHPSGVEVVLVDRPGIPSVGFPGPWGCGGGDARRRVSHVALATQERARACRQSPGRSPLLPAARRVRGRAALPARKTPCS